MKFFISLFVIIALGALIYFKTKRKQIALIVVLVLLGLLIYLIRQADAAPDTWCTTTHTTTENPPSTLKTGLDYFNQANYDYDTGNCQKAIIEYSVSIEKNPNYPQAYNNRAYTYMRLRDYKDALPDLDRAIILNPSYIQALMNRGDIHNYYYQIDKNAAIADYKKVIALGATSGTSVCGHLFLAEHNGWNLGTILALPSQFFGACN